VETAVVISDRGYERVRAGHPWIYRSDLVQAQAAGGDVVRVIGPRGRHVGIAHYSDRSEIALRMLAREHDGTDPIALVRARLAAAIDYRRSLAIDATACRLVHAEADLLPALVVDRYGEYLVVQALSQGMARLQSSVCDALVELLAPRGIVARNDSRVRLLEGLEQRVEVVEGEVPERVEVREGPVAYDVSLLRGQKTGLFLDQRENRAAAAACARGRVLDCFCYQGGFALHLAPHATETIAVDISADAIAQAERNARRNGVRVTTRVANVFDELRALERQGQRFETIVLDPPAFARSRGSLPRALAGYKEINLRALKLLARGGHLVTCTCSYHVDEGTFGEVLFEAAVDAQAPVVVVEKRMQARDHPVLLGVPETYYLKCLILRRL
jgi:23S rRNA (cytosine1962-C5)-methyltransferase